MKRLSRNIVEFSTTHFKWVIGFIVLLTIISGASFPFGTIDTDPENMLEQTEPARSFHNETKQTFSLSDAIVLGIINDSDPDGVFNPDTLSRIYELTQFSKTLRWPNKQAPEQFEGVIEVDMIAPSMLDHMSNSGPGTLSFEWLMAKPPTTREEALAIKEKALSNPLLKGQMVSADGRALSLYLPLSDKLLSYQVYEALQQKIKSLGGNEAYHIAGLPVAEGAIGVEMFTQMTVASPLAMLVVAGLLYLFFRRWSLVFLPLIISTVSIVITMGAMIMCGYPVHILSSMLPIFLMSIAMVDSIHVISEYFDVYTVEKGCKASIAHVLETLFLPMLYTSLSTAVGFLSLALAPIPPARVFGVFLGIGVIVAWLVTILFVPAYLMLLPEKKMGSFGLHAQGQPKHNALTRSLAFIGRFTYQHTTKVLVSFVAIIAVSIWGITQIQVNDNYAKRFDLSHPLRQADIALNQHFGGIYMAYLVLESLNEERLSLTVTEKTVTDLYRFADAIKGDFPDAPSLAIQLAEKIQALSSDTLLKDAIDSAIEYGDTLLSDATEREYDAIQELQTYLGLEQERLKVFKDPLVLNYMADLQAHLLELGLIGKSMSVADVVSKVNQELIDGQPENFRIPDKMQSVSECYLQYQQSHRPNDLWHLVTPDYSQANIQMQFPTGDSMNTKATVDAVNAYFKANPPPVALAHQWAGLHYINLVLEDKLVWGFLKSLIGSFLLVFMMMTYLFRSAKWGLLCMIPLSITLLMIYGITGIVGKDYDLPIAVLSALSIGMAVDFAIHFLQRSRVIYQTVGSWKATVPAMFREPSRAISRNVFVIAIGFLPLMTASLIPYQTTGALLFMILFCSGLITLLALPAILKTWEGLFFRSLSTPIDSQQSDVIESKPEGAA